MWHLLFFIARCRCGFSARTSLFVRSFLFLVFFPILRLLPLIFGMPRWNVDRFTSFHDGLHLTVSSCPLRPSPPPPLPPPLPRESSGRPSGQGCAASSLPAPCALPTSPKKSGRRSRLFQIARLSPPPPLTSPSLSFPSPPLAMAQWPHSMPLPNASAASRLVSIQLLRCSERTSRRTMGAARGASSSERQHTS